MIVATPSLRRQSQQRLKGWSIPANRSQGFICERLSIEPRTWLGVYTGTIPEERRGSNDDVPHFGLVNCCMLSFLHISRLRTARLIPIRYTQINIVLSPTASRLYTNMAETSAAVQKANDFLTFINASPTRQLDYAGVSFGILTSSSIPCRPLS